MNSVTKLEDLRFFFRVWSEDAKEYLFKNTRVLNGDFLAFNEESVVFEQCTGLCDSKGKLIYEGDIIELKMFRFDCNTGITKQCYQSHSPVTYKDGCFWLGFSTPLFNICKSDTTAEVIGNIHQHHGNCQQ